MTGNVPSPRPGEWRSLLGKLMLLAVAIVAADRALGAVVSSLANRATTGDRIGMENVVLASRPAMLFMGSSHTRHHYDDSLLTERLGRRVRNAGADGTGVVYARAMWSLLPAEHRPQAVVFEMSWFADELARVHALDYYYGRSALLDSMLTADGWRSRVKLASVLYRYNGMTGPMLRALKSQAARPWGYAPLEGSMDSLPPVKDSVLDAVPHPGAWFESNLRTFIHEVRSAGADFVLSESPSLSEALPPVVVEAYRRIATDSAVPILDFSTASDSAFGNPRFYRDATHLNADGARILTEIVAERLRMRYRGAGEVAPLR